MPVIAIASEIGSEGKTIAQAVAARLGLSILDHGNIFERFAQHGCWLPKSTTAAQSHATPLENNWQLRKIGKIISSEILFLAQKNSMMLHSPFAPYLLAGISHIPRIQIRAPVATRAKNLSGAAGNHETEARQHVRQSDARIAFILETCFGVESPNRAEHFDLVADTGWLNSQDWAEQIVDLAQDPDFIPTAASRSKLRTLAADAAAPCAPADTLPCACPSGAQC